MAERPRTATETAALHTELVTLGMARAERLEGRLAKILAPILANAGADAARRFEEFATDHLTASLPLPSWITPPAGGPPLAIPAWAAELLADAAEIASTSTMVAVKPRPDQAAALARDGGTPPDDLHVTICYIGDFPGDLKPISEALARVAASHAPLEGVVGGTGSFASGEDGAPQIALPDVPGLSELRVAVTQALVDAGIEYARDHGFLPHLTVDYSDTAVGDEAHGLPLNFDDLLIVRGGNEVVPLPLTGSRPLTAAAPFKGLGWALANAWTHSNSDGSVSLITDASLVPVEDIWIYGLTASAPWTPPSGDELVNVASLVQALRTKTDPVREAFLRAVMTPALRDAGINFDVTNPLTAQAFASTGQHITSIAETTQLNVMRIIRESYTQGLSIPETAKAIQEGMKAASLQRATMIARTEMVGAVSAGALAATRLVEQQTGDQYVKVWMTAPGAMYPRHEDYEGLDGQTVRTGAPFEVGAAMLMYPGDPTGPPGEVINCRCSLSFKSAVDAANEMAGIDSGGIAGPPMVPPPSDTVSVGAGPFLSRAALSKIDRLGLDAPLKNLKPTSEIGQQLYATAPDTQHLYSSVGPSGTYDDAVWTPDRKALHNDIIARIFEGKTPNPDEPLRAFYTAGGGASGKSAALFKVDGKDIGLEALGKRADVIHIDPDMIKEALPEYGKLRDAGDFYAASGVHEESSMLAKAITSEAEKRGFSVIIDTTGSSSTFPAKLAASARKGYEIQVSMFSTPTNEAIARSLKRGAKRGRYVALQALKGAHAGASRELGIWKDLDLVKEWRVWDNTGTTPKLVAEGGGGAPATVYDEANWQRILAKADEGGGGRAVPAAPSRGVFDVSGVSPEAHDAIATAESSLNDVFDIQNAAVKIAELPNSDTATARLLRDGSIGIHSDTEAATLSSAVIHEYGHYLDSQILGTPEEWATASAKPEFEKLYETMKGTPTVQAIRGDKIEILKGDTVLRNQLLQGREMFARAIEEYVALRSGNSVLLGNLNKILGDKLLGFQYWKADEFAPIAQQLDAIFRERGLLTPDAVGKADEALVPAKPTVATLVPGPSPATLEHTASVRGAPIHQWATYHDMSVGEFTAALDKQVVAAVTPDTDVAIRVNATTLNHILDDGRFKSQFETNTSNGSLAPETRAEAEKKMFGYPEDLPAEQRPIYGYLLGSEDPHHVGQYGEVIVKMKPDVRDRTTFTLSDSLGPALHNEVIPAPVLQPSASAIPIDKYTDPYHPALPPLKSLSQSYAEAQIHGGVSLADVEEVLIPEGYRAAAIVREKADVAGYEHWVKTVEGDIARDRAILDDPTAAADAKAGAEYALRGHLKTLETASEILGRAQERLKAASGVSLEDRLDALGIKWDYR